MADDDRFYVKSLTLENFRCFEKTELGPFDPHFNLIVGENGSGKSSVLVALAEVFSPFGSLSGETKDAVFSSARDYRRPPNAAMVFLESVSWKNSVAFSVNDKDYRAERSWRGRENRSVLDIFFVKNDGFQIIGDSYLPKVQKNDELIAFYSTTRRFSENAVTTIAKNSFESRELAYDNWWQAGMSADSLRDWLKDLTLIALQREQQIRDRGASHLSTLARPQLTIVSQAISQAIPNVTRVEFDATFADITVQMDRGSVCSFRELSDGQRAFVGMVADLARRANLLNYEKYGDKVLEETTGLVFIDEIDLHLHPRWQRLIIDALKRIFPKLQFFATTHSPQVIGEAQPEEIVLLTKDGKQKRPMGSFGMDSNWVLECLMETDDRDPAIAKRIKSLFGLIEDDRLDEAKAEIAQLRKFIDGDPEITAAQSYIWNLEHTPDTAAE